MKANSSNGPTLLDDPSGVSLTPALEAETERLLSQRTRDIRFSTEMMQAYRKRTWRQRSKIARAWMVWVGLISMAFVPVSYLLAPSLLRLTAIVAGLLTPTLHGLVYLVWRKPRSALVEGLSVVLLMGSIMILFAMLGAAAGGGDAERFLFGILFVNAIAIVVLNVEYVFALALMVDSLAIFLTFEILNPAIKIEEAIGTTVFFAMGMYAVTIARKTQFILSQRTFLMSLRDQYRSEALKIAATRDPLTGLANRRSAARLIETLWRESTIAKESIAFVMADIDSFKRLNDSAGHAAGDACIQRVAHTIEQTVRANEDAVFRYGGEEFLIVLTDATPDLAFQIAERIRCAVEALAIVNPGIGRTGGVVTISLGVAFACDAAGPELVAKWADDALYDAKRSGRNLVFLSTARAQDRRSTAALPASPADQPPHRAAIALSRRDARAS